MRKLLIAVTAVLAALAVLLALAYRQTGASALLAMAITAGTTGYHFGVRLLIGLAFNRFPLPDYTRAFFRQRPFEAVLYEHLRVRSWKTKLPTFDPASFSPALHTWDEIARTMCRSELVHWACAAFSFLPLIMILPFGEPVVFALTSLAGAALDLCFVMIQRFNRPTVLRLVQRKKAREASSIP